MSGVSYMGDRGPQLIAITTSFLVVSWVAISLRCYTRIRLKPPFRASDALSVVSLAVYTTGSVFLVVAVRTGGLGQHVTGLAPDIIAIGLQFILFYELSYVLATVLVKLSIALFLLQFTTTNKSQTYIIYCIVIINIAYSIFLFFFALFQCHPVSEFWLRVVTPQQGSCMEPSTIIGITYAHSAIVCLADWTLATIPIFIAHRLTLHFSAKCYVAGILALGSLAVIATIARFPYVQNLETLDYLFYKTDLVIWSHVEIGVALVASSAVTFRPLLNLFMYRTCHICRDERAQ